MVDKKNILHSKLDKKYRELKRRITSALYMLKEAKRKEWDQWTRLDRETFYAIKAKDIQTRKELLKDMHRNAREMKELIWYANHRECCSNSKVLC